MGDLLERTSCWLGRMRSRHLSHPIVYIRDSDSVQVAATVGKTEFEVQDAYGAMEQWESRDFLVTAADLVLAGVTVTPSAAPRSRMAAACTRCSPP